MQSKKTDDAKIYLGPSIPGTILNRYAIFRGELHHSIGQLCEQVPAIKRLIVGVSVMAEHEKKLGDKTSVQHSSFVSVLNHIKGVNKQ